MALDRNLIAIIVIYNIKAEKFQFQTGWSLSLVLAGLAGPGDNPGSEVAPPAPQYDARCKRRLAGWLIASGTDANKPSGNSRTVLNSLAFAFHLPATPELLIHPLSLARYSR